MREPVLIMGLQNLKFGQMSFWGSIMFLVETSKGTSAVETKSSSFVCMYISTCTMSDSLGRMWKMGWDFVCCGNY